jgi:hypothetical protein
MHGLLQHLGEHRCNMCEKYPLQEGFGVLSVKPVGFGFELAALGSGTGYRIYHLRPPANGGFRCDQKGHTRDTGRTFK